MKRVVFIDKMINDFENAQCFLSTSRIIEQIHLQAQCN